jgi:DNA-3-methyladenine glycosylase
VVEDELTRLLSGSADIVAPRLLGCRLTRLVEGVELSGKIVETEAYSQDDVASHSYRGETPRTKVMFGPPGFLYVYFTYGMHYCCNVVTGRAGHGSAVLIRALEPLTGADVMSVNRRGLSGAALTNGPAKLCQALQINKQLNGQDLRAAPLRLETAPPLPQQQIIKTTRIGISQGQDVPWRFYIKDNAYVSRT